MMTVQAESRPDTNGHFGQFGGRYVAETLMPAILELEEAYTRITPQQEFQQEFHRLLKSYAGRPTPLYLAGRLTHSLKGAAVYLKCSQDQQHTGAGPARQVDGKRQVNSRNGSRPARGGDRHCGRSFRYAVPDLYGR